MTGKLSRERAYPEACSKCGVEFIPGARYREQHFRSAHPDAIGTATLKSDPEASGEFVYVAPAYHEPGAWLVVWMAAPFEVVKMHRDLYVIQWKKAGADPAEGDRT